MAELTRSVVHGIPYTFYAEENPSTRRFERITGISAIWIPSQKLFVAPSAKIHVEGKEPKAACRSLLEKNLVRIRRILVERQNGKCSECEKAKPLHLHHIRHRGIGGGSRDDRLINLQLCCYACHRKKHQV